MYNDGDHFLTDLRIVPKTCCKMVNHRLVNYKKHF